jgi:hypothetical protein
MRQFHCQVPRSQRLVTGLQDTSQAFSKGRCGAEGFEDAGRGIVISIPFINLIGILIFSTPKIDFDIFLNFHIIFVFYGSI